MVLYHHNSISCYIKSLLKYFDKTLKYFGMRLLKILEIKILTNLNILIDFPSFVKLRGVP